MQKIKINGAGSIGNHLAHAARSLCASVDLCDISPEALQRTRDEIYVQRYDLWDDNITLYLANDVPKGGYDLICVGTPPDSHIPLAIEALDEAPGAILIEKPLCPPNLDGLEALIEKSSRMKVPVFVGYDHVVGAATEDFEKLAGENPVGEGSSLSVYFQEHWKGIFAAHPWLQGPQDSYLGFWSRGGGASGEHSHALNLWQHFARRLGAGEVVEVQARMEYVKEGGVEYDRLAEMSLCTETGFKGQVIQDVLTNPPKKMARLQGDKGFVEWHCGFEPGCDAIIWGGGSAPSRKRLFKKTRPDDFIRELSHILNITASGNSSWKKSPIALVHGADTMLLLSAAHRSALEGCAMRIDRTRGYAPQAIISV